MHLLSSSRCHSWQRQARLLLLGLAAPFPFFLYVYVIMHGQN